MSTALDLITNSLLLIGAIAATETPTTQEQTDGLYILNDLIDSWNAQPLMLPAVVGENIALSNPQSFVWLGPDAGGEVISGQVIGAGVLQTSAAPTARAPQNIRFASYTNSAASNPTARTQLTIVPYSELLTLSATPATGLPQFLALQNFYPNSIAWLYPTVNLSTLQLQLIFDQALPTFASAGSTNYLPPGYSRALRYNLAVEMAAQMGRALPEQVAEIAKSSKAAIENRNLLPTRMKAQLLALRQAGRLEAR